MHGFCALLADLLRQIFQLRSFDEDGHASAVAEQTKRTGIIVQLDADGLEIRHIPCAFLCPFGWYQSEIHGRALLAGAPGSIDAFVFVLVYEAKLASEIIAHSRAPARVLGPRVAAQGRIFGRIHERAQ